MDNANESPLDVLSRAATMVQNNVLPPSYSYGGGGKWRRIKQRRPPPQYSSSVAQSSSSSSSADSPTPGSPLVHTTTTSNGEPIDLSTRRIRGLPPPSYSETMQCKQVYLRQNNRDSLVSSSSDVGGALCDPMIDEHFRRSLLGQGYHSDEEEEQLSTSTPIPAAATALSVDDHFAKSLGENWLEFLREEEEAKQRQNNYRRLSSDVPV